MASKDDTSLWLHNKLGSQLWNNNYSTIIANYSTDRLLSIKDCFQNLDSYVKIKFFLSLFYLPKRMQDELQMIIKDIIDISIDKSNDQWVLSIALFIKSYWEKKILKGEYINFIDSFQDVFNDLRNSLLKKETIWLLPLECNYLSKTGKSSYDKIPQSSKHFNLIRLAKSAALIQDIKSKGSCFSKIKKTRYLTKQNTHEFNNSIDYINPITTPGFLKRSNLHCSTITGKINIIKRDTGIKLLGLEDQPLSNKEFKRKKKEHEKEDIKKIKLDSGIIAKNQSSEENNEKDIVS